MIEAWREQFGNDYTDRNQYDPALRAQGLKEILEGLDIQTILEVGCNTGLNLTTLLSLGYSAVGVEPNEYARNEGIRAGRAILNGEAKNLPQGNETMDLVFTCGVLIHIPPNELQRAMEEIWNVAKKYVLAIEYKGPEEAVTYRGNVDMLWKRPEYKYPGTLIKEGQLGKEFDNCYYWLYKKK